MQSIVLNGYSAVSRRDRRDGSGFGGIILISRNDCEQAIVHICTSDDAEIYWHVLRTDVGAIAVALWYRPPHRGNYFLPNTPCCTRSCGLGSNGEVQASGANGDAGADAGNPGSTATGTRRALNLAPETRLRCIYTSAVDYYWGNAAASPTLLPAHSSTGRFTATPDGTTTHEPGKHTAGKEVKTETHNRQELISTEQVEFCTVSWTISTAKHLPIGRLVWPICMQRPAGGV